MIRSLSFNWSIVVLLAAFFSLAGCGYGSSTSNSTLEDIKERGHITLITQNNANTYYIYRQQPSGFEYDLAKRFSEHLGVDLKVITPGWNRMIPMLLRGKGDFIGAGMTIAESRLEKVDFSRGYMGVQQQIVVHRSSRGINQISDLDGETIHIKSGTTYEERLKELKERDDLDFTIRTYDNIPTEELIRRVDNKKIPVTVADSTIAMLNRRYYPDIRIAFPIEEEQALGWAVRKEDDALLREINAFLKKAKKDGTFGRIYERYYADVHIFDYVDLKRFHQRLESRLGKFKGMIKKEARKYGFDWKLIAAVIYQESHFDPNARSYTGVRGLMQVTQRTAKEMGITNRLDPEQSVRAGVKYLDHLYKRWEELSGQNRMKFALASYNIGYGHVRDAQKLARKQGMDPQEWSDMKEVLPLLRIKKYYSQTRYGYARGTEPVRYIQRIMKYYSILKRREDIASAVRAKNESPL